MSDNKLFCVKVRSSLARTTYYWSTAPNIVGTRCVTSDWHIEFSGDGQMSELSAQPSGNNCWTTNGERQTLIVCRTMNCDKFTTWDDATEDDVDTVTSQCSWYNRHHTAQVSRASIVQHSRRSPTTSYKRQTTSAQPETTTHIECRAVNFIQSNYMLSVEQYKRDMA